MLVGVALAAFSVSAFLQAGRSAPLPLCTHAPSDWQCWQPDGAIAYGELPASHRAYWEWHTMPARYASADAARRAIEEALRRRPPWLRHPHRRPPQVVS